MGYAARRGVLLGLQQPMQSLGGSELKTACIALSTVNRLDRLAPAQATRQFYREHPTFPRPALKQYGTTRNDAMPIPLRTPGEMVNGIGQMSEDDLAARIARYRETAETLRGIAERLRFDPRRGNQLGALADGFERFALHLETMMGRAAD